MQCGRDFAEAFNLIRVLTFEIACIGYRQWALNIYQQIITDFPENSFLMQLSKRIFLSMRLRGSRLIWSYFMDGAILSLLKYQNIVV